MFFKNGQPFRFNVMSFVRVTVSKKAPRCCRWDCLGLMVIWVGFCSSSLGADDPGVGPVRQIRAVLADRCFRCHGPDAAERHVQVA